MSKNEEEIAVKVAVRVRPLVDREKLANERSCVRLVLDKNQLIIGRDKNFTFDYVFPPRSAQPEIFEACVSSLVSGFLEGYNSTVFAYGQTGSGKTYTVTGDVLDPAGNEQFGLVPRAISTFFHLLKHKSGKAFSVRVSYIEIYKEELHDLLRPDTSPKDLHIREDDAGNTVLFGVEEVPCANDADVFACLRRGSAVRHTGATGMNDQSSRSHSVFTITLEQTWMTELEVQQNIVDAVEGQQNNAMQHIIRSKFHFVDLAGSERAARTKNVGDRFKESVHINSGLLALGNVIGALSEPRRRTGHVPYRDSKITRLLKDSLGGNAKTLMICCIGPAEADMDESLNSLNYASRARNIKNKPVINQDAQTRKFEAMKSEIMTLRDELNRQRTLMTNLNVGTPTDGAALVDDQGNRLRELEDKIGNLHAMCAQYRVASEEAYRQLIALDQAQLLSTSQNSRFKSWLGIIDHLRNSTLPNEHIDEIFSETIKKLEDELKRAKEELKSDEEIFADRAKQIRNLEKTAESALNDREKLAADAAKHSAEIIRLQQMLVAKEVEVNELRNQQQAAQAARAALISRSVDVGNSLAFQPSNEEPGDTRSEGGGQFPRLRPSTMLPVSNQRPRSVPALEKNYGSRPLSRHVHTSPAFVSADKVMQSFRARSALLQSRLEDSDIVLVKSAESGESAEDEDATPNATVKEGSPSGNEFGRRGTYRVVEGKKIAAKIAAGQTTASPNLQSSKDQSSNKATTALAESRDRATKLNDQLGDLQAQIRLKEQLIAQLVRSGRENDRVAQEQAEIIRSLQREKDQTASELREVQVVLEKMEADRSTAAESVRVDYEQKLDAARKKMNVLKKKQAEASEKASSLAKLDDLKTTLGNLKQQQANLQKRLKEEMDVKVKLEREVEKDQVKIRQLEERSQQQERMLRQRADQLVSARRRSARPGTNNSETASQSGVAASDVDVHRQWLESEVEKVTQAREQLRQLEQQLAGQQDLLAKREAMVGEREKLILRKMRSSQALSHELSSIKYDTTLQAGRAQLDAQRKVLADRLASGMILSAVEERRLAEFDEAIDAVDQALDYRREALGEVQASMPADAVRQSTANVHDQLKLLNGDEARQLLEHLFDRVVELRDVDSRSRLQIAQLETQLNERERVVRTLESALQESKIGSLTARVDVDERAQRLSREINRDLQVAKKTTNDLRNRIVAAATLQQQSKVPNNVEQQQENVSNATRSATAASKISSVGDSTGGFLGTAANPPPDSPTVKQSFFSRGSEMTLISARRTPHVLPPVEMIAPLTASTEQLQASSSSTATEHLTPVRVSRRGLRELSPSTIEARKRQQQQQQNSNQQPQSASYSVADSLESPSKRH